MKEIETKQRQLLQVVEDVPPATQETQESEEKVDADDLLDAMEEEMAQIETGEEVVALDSVEAVCADEIDRYVRAAPLERRKMVNNRKVFNDPLVWWKQNQGMFPILAKLAMKYLAVQATSAPSERVFSQAQLMIRANRARMGPEIAGKLLFVKMNWDLYSSSLNLLDAAQEEEDEIEID